MYYVVTDEEGAWLMHQKPTENPGDPNTEIELETNDLHKAEQCLCILLQKEG